MYYQIMAFFTAIYMAVATLFMGTPSAMTQVNPDPVPEAEVTQSFTVMTYNLKTSGAGQYSVENRKDMLIANVRAYMPDSVGFEEANETWMQALPEGLPEYDYVGEARDGNGKGEASPIFWLKDKYDLVDGGTFWLSETPDTVSKGWDAVIYNRVCTYAILKDKETGFTYAHFNAHTDNLAVYERQEAVALISKKIAELCPDIPVIFSGDLNDDEGSDMYNRILESGMKDTKYLAAETMDSGTYHGYSAFDEKNRTKPIDFIFVNAFVKEVASYKVDLQKYNGIYPSDHHPVIVELTLFNGGK